MRTLLFYDIETSGLNSAFDQILTFACIRTNLDLVEIDRETITVQLRKDIVPSPKAFLTHRLTFSELKLGISEYEAALKIHEIVNTPGTISLGYNSLGFDDEFLRFLFYRNLLDPYAHQYANGCSRMDVLPITVIFKVFQAQALRWPEIDGKPSLKLEWISRKNQFVTSGKAHEALNDVEAVIELCKRFIRQKDIWDYSLNFFNKTRDEVRINDISSSLDITIQNEKFTVGLMVSASFGASVNYLAPVILLGHSKAYKNQSLWLRIDSDKIAGIDDEQDSSNAFVIRKRPSDERIVLPALERFWNKMPISSQQSAAANIEKIHLQEKRFLELVAYHKEYKYPFVSDMDPDAALYQDGFFSYREKEECSLFHKTRNHHKKEILNKIKNPRIVTLAKRILARNFGNKSEFSRDGEYNLHMDRLRSPAEKDRIVGYKQDTKLNCQQGLEQIIEIEKELLKLDEDQKRILSWLKEYIGKL